MNRFAILLPVVWLTVGSTSAVEPVIDRSLGKEPVYQTKMPKYGMLVFGAEARERAWVVLDGDTLYVDRNGNGDLTDPGEKVAPVKKNRVGDELSFDVGELAVAGKTHKGFGISFTPLEQLAKGWLAKFPDAKAALAKDKKAMSASLWADVEMPGMKGGGLGGRVSFLAGVLDLNGVLMFADEPAKAPVVRLGGPLQVTFYGELPELRIGRETELCLVAGTPGIGPGTFAMVNHSITVPEEAKPVAEITWPAAKPGDRPTREAFEIKKRCCGVNYHDSVCVADKTSVGVAEVTLSYGSWKGGEVAPTTHSITILPSKAGPKPEPIAPNLIASLTHPERKAGMGQLQFSSDNARLFASGYPSGIVQIWDIETKNEIRRIDSPPGRRSSLDYALLAPDWKTLYVPVEKRTVKPFEREGKRDARFEYAGEFRTWDIATGKEKESLEVAQGSAPKNSQLSPNGRFLVYFEQPSYNASEPGEGSTKTCDLATGKGMKLFDGDAYCSFFPTGNTVAVAVNDLEAGKSELRLLDVATGKVLAKRANPEKGRFFRVDSVSPDGRFVVCHVVAIGKKTSLEVQLLDAKTLELRDRLIGQGEPDQVVRTAGKFTPDGKWYAVTDGIGNVLLWDVAERKLARTIPIGSCFPVWQLGTSADGKILAVAWMPQPDAGLGTNPETDPQDLPQPRVSLIALDGMAPPKVLIAPHGYTGGVAFSPNGKMLAFGSLGAVHLFDLTR